jgi:hypothetical protein
VKWIVPGIARLGAVIECDAFEGADEVLLRMPFVGFFVELCGDFADQIDEGCSVALLIVSIFILRQAAAELRVELRGRNDLGCCKGVCAVERERADVDGLPRLVDGLFGGQEDRYFVLELDVLGEFGRTDWGVCDVTHLVFASDTGGEAELGLDSAAMVEATAEEWTWLLVGDEEFDTECSGFDNLVVVGVGDDDPDGGLAAREVLGLAEGVDDGATEDLRD